MHRPVCALASLPALLLLRPVDRLLSPKTHRTLDMCWNVQRFQLSFASPTVLMLFIFWHRIGSPPHTPHLKNKPGKIASNYQRNVNKWWIFKDPQYARSFSNKTRKGNRQVLWSQKGKLKLLSPSHPYIIINHTGLKTGRNVKITDH